MEEKNNMTAEEQQLLADEKQARCPLGREEARV